MDRKQALASLLGCIVGAGAIATAAFVMVQGTGLIAPACPLEFGLSPLNTSYGWFYRIEWQKTEPRPLREYNATFFVFSSPDARGNQQKLVHHVGALMDLVGSTGNFSFEDRGVHPEMLDNGGDYFWTREWHNIEVERLGRMVGGTLACA
jgi:hypothetical protein